MTEERTRELIVSLLQDIAGSLRTANELRREMLGGCQARLVHVVDPLPKPGQPRQMDTPVQLAACDPAAINVKAFADACLVKAGGSFRSIPMPVAFHAYNTWCGLKGIDSYLATRSELGRVMRAVTRHQPTKNCLSDTCFAPDVFPPDFNPWECIRVTYEPVARDIHKKLVGGCKVFVSSDLGTNVGRQLRLHWLGEAFPEWFDVIDHIHPRSRSRMPYPALVKKSKAKIK